MMTLTCTVTEAHIAARVFSPEIAALRDAAMALGMKPSNLTSDLQTMRFTDAIKGERYVFPTPADVQEKMQQFDQGVEIEPFTFVLIDPKVIDLKRKQVDKPQDHDAG
jgi:hypothetical protein